VWQWLSDAQYSDFIGFLLNAFFAFHAPFPIRAIHQTFERKPEVHMDWRPARGHAPALVIAAFVLFSLAAIPAFAADAAFQQWLAATWPEAQALGVSRSTFDSAIRGLEPDLSLPDLAIPGRAQAPQRGQAEFVQTPADYLKEANIARLAAEGARLRAQHAATLEGIEKKFGVPGQVVLAIWGRETDFGHYKLPNDAIRVLATQAYVGKRKDMFRQEFLLALKMLQEGLVKRADMRSSWGGAMGMTQFLPSEFYKHGVDFDGDGRPDIFKSVPDALASAAKQLVDKGWQPGRRWAYEVHAPARFDCTLGVPEVVKPIGEWIKAGFVPAYGRQLRPDELAEPASVLQPEGIYGPAFLAPKNYFVIKEYNFSDLYVLFVGQVSDRIVDPRQHFETPWSQAALMRTADVETMQNILTARGLYQDKVDGKAGMKTRAAFGAYQKANGLKLDCWPGVAVLDHMRSHPAAAQAR
jgi:lytic murein transglycosylase